MADVLLRYWYFSTLMERRYPTIPVALRAARTLVAGANGVPAAILRNGEMLYDEAWLEEYVALPEHHRR